MLKDMCYRLGMADIWKCFDQVVPLLAHSILAIAGVPAPTLGAYSRMMNNVTVVNSLSIGIGEPYRRHCSIPQGCPWSMMILALLVRPWIHTIEACTAAVPRALADDFCLWAQECRACITQQADDSESAMREDFAMAVNITHTFLNNIGAKAAYHKCDPGK